MLRSVLLAALAAALFAVPAAIADHIPGQPCTGCASHAQWPSIDGVYHKAKHQSATFVGSERSDQLLGHHGSDVLRGRGGSDVLWGDWQGTGQPTTQRDRIYGGGGTDFIYGSHGRNVIYAGAGNDAISVHYGRGFVDCGPGRDIYHVARTRRRGYKFRNCEKVDYRSERQRGGGLKPLR
ncbi:MAG TPA: calcium-binding protein [Solirubrobacteraceae bacterium]|nr:calcium-binding protein [Solirubrobacteraceae bacterium]